MAIPTRFGALIRSLLRRPRIRNGFEWRYHEPLTGLRRCIFFPPPREGLATACSRLPKMAICFARSRHFRWKRGKAKRVDFPPTTAPIFRLLINSAHAPDVQLAEGWLLREGDRAVVPARH